MELLLTLSATVLAFVLAVRAQQTRSQVALLRVHVRSTSSRR
ncbi:hypothetical protein [Deinococcus sonorensis]|uniref:Uncharacterized protein n=2 Tax=Deinococcus sonorensis TaxID=309891 RepID=A0AAU7UBS9_9DEIO